MRPHPSIRHLPWALLFSVLSVISAGAQAPEISGVWPAGGQRGTSVSMEVQGHNLQGAALLMSGSGIKVESVGVNPAGDSASVKLAISADAPLGPREIRITSARGASNPACLWVDVLPERQEIENNDDAVHAQTLDRAEAVVNGRIQAPTDRDVFAVLAHAGETWQFDCSAARLRSRLDPVLELRDEAGHTLRMAQSTWENDPRLIYTFTRSGRYLLTVRDTQFLGGPDYVYRLTTGPMPIITGYLPRGGQPGKRTALRLSGINLDPAAGSIPVSIPDTASPGEIWVSPLTAGGPAPAVPILVDTAPVVVAEQTTSTAAVLSPPICVDGAFTQFPLQRFRLHASPATHLELDLLGRRIGSRIDGAIRVLDAAGKEVAANDDAEGKDARLEFAAPAEGDYTIEVRNVEEKLGDDCFYRLTVRPAKPDFHVRLDTDRLQVGAGGTTAIGVTAERLYGFTGAIEVSAHDLPAGVVCSGGTIAPGQTSVEITLTAPVGAPLAVSAIHVYGSAVVDGKTVEREAPPREQYLPRSIDPGMFTDDSYRKPYRVCEILPLGVVARGESFSLVAATAAVTLVPGAKAEIVVKAIRRSGSKGEIKLELRGLPDKVTAAPVSIPAEGSEAHITLTAAADAPGVVKNLIIQGRLDKESQPAPAIRITVKH